MPKSFLKAVDDAAIASYMSRSNYIRIALMQKMGWKNQIQGPNEPDKEQDIIDKLLAEL